MTPADNVLVDYADGSTLVAADLDTSNLQHLYLEQELDDALKQSIAIDSATGLPTAGNQRITNVANPVNVQDAATKAYVDAAVVAGSVPNADYGDIVVTNNGSTWTIDSSAVTNAKVATAAAIAGTKISPDFGTQNTLTSGTSTAASFIPTSTTVPTNGVYLAGANAVGIATNSTNKITFDSSGNIGIGANISPRGNVEISKSLTYGQSVNQSVYIGASNVGSGVNDGYALAWKFNVAGDENGQDFIVSAVKRSGASNVESERLRIDTSGNVGIGRAPTCALDLYAASGNLAFTVDSDSLANTQQTSIIVSGGARAQSFSVYKHSGITNPCGYVSLNAEDNALNFLWTDNSDILRISTTATNIGTTGGSVVGDQTSDERIKNILGPVEYGLDALKQIEPVRYTYKSNPDVEKIGFIAQQVQPIVPQSVYDTKDRIEGEPEDAPTKLAMEYAALIPVLVNAIKELSAEVDALKAQLP